MLKTSHAIQRGKEHSMDPGLRRDDIVVGSVLVTYRANCAASFLPNSAPVIAAPKAKPWA